MIRKRPDLQVLISVPTDVLKNQWQDHVIKRGLIKNVKVEIINTIIKSQHTVDLLVIDEAHVAAASTFKTIFECVNYKMVLCLTGTLERLDGKETIIKTYAPVVDIIDVKEAVANGWLSGFTEYKVLLDVDLTEYKIQHALFLENFATFDYKFDVAMAAACGVRSGSRFIKYPAQCQLEWAKFLAGPNAGKAKIDDALDRVKGAAYQWLKAMQARKAYSMKHPHKIEVAQKILDARPDSKAITFSATIEMAEKIKRGYVYIVSRPRRSEVSPWMSSMS